jgi:hypothetical protein
MSGTGSVIIEPTSTGGEGGIDPVTSMADVPDDVHAETAPSKASRHMLPAIRVPFVQLIILAATTEPHLKRI